MSTQIVETVTHGGDSYTFDSQSQADAVVVYEGEGRMSDYCHTIYYDFTLSGAHDGPPIKVRMVGPDEERDEDGAYPTWEKLLFVDDGTEVESAWILDFYSDALHDELGQIIRETWD
ncbi:MAG: hypothetical protein WCD76_16910 [Pyrinomonadaceae bacterium]